MIHAPQTAQSTTKPAAARVCLHPAARMLEFDFGGKHQTLSWALLNGGLGRMQRACWFQVTDQELMPPVDPISHLKDRLGHGPQSSSTVGLLTSASLQHYVDRTISFGDVWARCVVTVGLGNALRAGDPPSPDGRIGTINTVCQISQPLTTTGLIEASSIMSEAKTMAVMEAGISSRRSGLPATGTGTDCQVIASPPSRHSAENYAGKHTKIGYVIGEAVGQATRQGIELWRERQLSVTSNPKQTTGGAP
jgi:adenosylcobinamide amidohydrolase